MKVITLLTEIMRKAVEDGSAEDEVDGILAELEYRQTGGRLHIQYLRLKADAEVPIGRTIEPS